MDSSSFSSSNKWDIISTVSRHQSGIIFSFSIFLRFTSYLQKYQITQYSPMDIIKLFQLQTQKMQNTDTDPDNSDHDTNNGRQRPPDQDSNRASNQLEYYEKFKTNYGQMQGESSMSGLSSKNFIKQQPQNDQFDQGEQFKFFESGMDLARSTSEENQINNLQHSYGSKTNHFVQQSELSKNPNIYEGMNPPSSYITYDSQEQSNANANTQNPQVIYLKSSQKSNHYFDKDKNSQLQTPQPPNYRNMLNETVNDSPQEQPGNEMIDLQNSQQLMQMDSNDLEYSSHQSQSNQRITELAQLGSLFNATNPMMMDQGWNKPLQPPQIVVKPPLQENNGQLDSPARVYTAQRLETEETRDPGSELQDDLLLLSNHSKLTESTNSFKEYVNRKKPPIVGDVKNLDGANFFYFFAKDKNLKMKTDMRMADFSPWLQKELEFHGEVIETFPNDWAVTPTAENLNLVIGYFESCDYSPRQIKIPVESTWLQENVGSSDFQFIQKLDNNKVQELHILAQQMCIQPLIDLCKITLELRFFQSHTTRNHLESTQKSGINHFELPHPKINFLKDFENDQMLAMTRLSGDPNSKIQDLGQNILEQDKLERQVEKHQNEQEKLTKLIAPIWQQLKQLKSNHKYDETLDQQKIEYEKQIFQEDEIIKKVTDENYQKQRDMIEIQSEVIKEKQNALQKIYDSVKTDNLEFKKYKESTQKDLTSRFSETQSIIQSCRDYQSQYLPNTNPHATFNPPQPTLGTDRILSLIKNASQLLRYSIQAIQTYRNAKVDQLLKNSKNSENHQLYPNQHLYDYPMGQTTLTLLSKLKVGSEFFIKNDIDEQEFDEMSPLTQKMMVLHFKEQDLISKVKDYGFFNQASMKLMHGKSFDQRQFFESVQNGNSNTVAQELRKFMQLRLQVIHEGISGIQLSNNEKSFQKRSQKILRDFMKKSQAEKNNPFLKQQQEISKLKQDKAQNRDETLKKMTTLKISIEKMLAQYTLLQSQLQQHQSQFQILSHIETACQKNIQTQSELLQNISQQKKQQVLILNFFYEHIPFTSEQQSIQQIKMKQQECRDESVKFGKHRDTINQQKMYQMQLESAKTELYKRMKQNTAQIEILEQNIVKWTNDIDQLETKKTQTENKRKKGLDLYGKDFYDDAKKLEVEIENINTDIANFKNDIENAKKQILGHKQAIQLIEHETKEMGTKISNVEDQKRKFIERSNELHYMLNAKKIEQFELEQKNLEQLIEFAKLGQNKKLLMSIHERMDLIDEKIEKKKKQQQAKIMRHDAPQDQEIMQDSMMNFQDYKRKLKLKPINEIKEVVYPDIPLNITRLSKQTSKIVEEEKIQDDDSKGNSNLQLKKINLVESYKYQEIDLGLSDDECDGDGGEGVSEVQMVESMEIKSDDTEND